MSNFHDGLAAYKALHLQEQAHMWKEQAEKLRRSVREIRDSDPLINDETGEPHNSLTREKIERARKIFG